MTKTQLSQAVAIAQNKQPLPVEDNDLSIFDGFGLQNFQPVTVTVNQLAALIRWQALRFNGTMDAEALNEIAEAGRKKFMVV